MDLFSILITFFQAHSYLAYLILFFGALFNVIIGIGFFVRGEVFFIIGGILGGTGELNIWLVVFVCIIGGIVGDTANYFIGRRFGPKVAFRIFKGKNKYLSRKLYIRALKFFNKHGKKSVFLGRFAGPISCITPFLAGVSKFGYRDFFKAEVPAAVIGIGQLVLIGYVFGFSYEAFLSVLKKYILYAFMVLGVVVIYFILRKFKPFKTSVI